MSMLDQKHWNDGFNAGFAACEVKVRKALGGHPQSELWGEHGLIAATMRSLDADAYHERNEEQARQLRGLLEALESAK